MSTDARRYDELNALFDELRDLRGSHREALLEARCAHDPELRAEVESLLAAHDTPLTDAFSEFSIQRARTSLEELLEVPEPDWNPQRIGNYRVVRRIGSGGMGVVYEALQESPQRRVAIKLLHPRGTTPERLRRFRQEAELLGRLQHPGIAQILEAGSYPFGAQQHPFFAMELVDGVGIRLYAERERLDVRERLELMAKVADAVQHAHDRGIIHRDLKPDNLLVDERGQPKILDFGVAHLSVGESRNSLALTQDGSLLGTLAYMAPEQLADEVESVTVRVDVYALGAIAFELLTGRLPQDIGGLRLTAALSVLRNEPIQSIGTLDASLSGDIATIVDAALERDPQRRYASAKAFADDIRRYLDDRPITARPPGALYRLCKYARRNRSLVASTVVLAIATLVSTFFGWRAAHERTEVQRQAYRSNMMAASLGIDSGSSVREHLDSVPPDMRGWEWHYLKSRLTDPLAELSGPVSFDLHLADDGSKVIAAGQSGTLERIDLESGRVEALIQLPGLPQASRLAPDERSIVAIGPSDLQEGRSWIGRFALQGAQSTAVHRFDALYRFSLSISPDARTACYADASALHLIDPDSGSMLASRDLCGVVATNYIPDGKLLAVADEQDTIRLLCSDTLETKLEMSTATEGVIVSIDVASSGAYLATGGSEGDLRIWNITSQPPSVSTLRFAQLGGACLVKFTPDGKVLATLHSDTTVRTWEPESARLIDEFRGHRVRPQSIGFVPDSSRIVTADLQGSVRAWDYGGDPFELQGHYGYVYGTLMLEELGVVVSGAWDGYFGRKGCLRMWDLESGEPVATLGGEGGIVTALAKGTQPGVFYAACARFPEGGQGKGIANAWSMLVEFDTLHHTRRERFRRDGALFDFIAIEPNGERVAWSTRDWKVTVANLATEDILAVRELARDGAGRPIGSPIDWSPDGKWIAACTTDYRIELWRADSLEVEGSWPAHDASIRSVEFSADSGLLISTSADTTAKLWSVPDGRAIETLRGHDVEVLCASFRPVKEDQSKRDARIATGDRNGQIRIWDGQSYELLADLSGHQNYVHDLTWAPDGQSLYSSSGDGTVRVWSTATRSERIAAKRERAWVEREFAPLPAMSERERQIARQFQLQDHLRELEGH